MCFNKEGEGEKKNDNGREEEIECASQRAVPPAKSDSADACESQPASLLRQPHLCTFDGVILHLIVFKSLPSNTDSCVLGFIFIFLFFFFFMSLCDLALFCLDKSPAKAGNKSQDSNLRCQWETKGSAAKLIMN